MQFEYQITVDDYVASQLLYWKLSKGRRHIEMGVWWTLVGTLFIVAAWNEHGLDYGPALLALSGAWLICAGMTNLFPSQYIRRAYRGLKLAGKKYQANLNEEGFEIVGDLCSWRVRWPGVLLKGESEHVFILNSEDGHLFMFGKKYLTEEQQQQLRRFVAADGA